MGMSVSGRPAAVLVATVLGVAITASLGTWQLRRAAQKVTIQSTLASRSGMPALGTADLATARTEAQTQHYRPVRLRGRWVAARTVFLDNRQMDARVGFYVVTPLQLDGRGDAVLVQRGWAPRDLRDRTLLPAIATPPGDVVVFGHIAPPPSRLYEFASSVTGLIRQNLDVEAFAAETGLTLVPLSVQQDSAPAAPDDGLLRHWARPAVDVQKHYGYAFQWFAMAALMAGLYVWFQLVRLRLRRDV
jgi:surfeit locus 1 family protein